MSIRLKQLVPGKIVGSEHIHFEELIEADVNEPVSYTKRWDIS